MKPRLAVPAAVLALVLIAAIVVIWAWPSSRPCVGLEVSSSTEKSAGIARIVRAYHDAGRTFEVKGDERCARISLNELSSGTAEQALAGDETSWPRGKPWPDVWLPTSSAWVALLRHEKPGAAPEVGPADSLARSPLVFALPRSKADAFRKGLADEGTAFDWPVIQRLVADGRPLRWGTAGLLRHGKPEWGDFALTKDDPVQSTSGLFALMALVQGAATDAAVPEYLRRIERLVPADVDQDGTEMMRKLRHTARCGRPDWGAGTSAVLIQESLMYQYDTDTLGPGTGSAPPCASPGTPEDLVPIYAGTGWVMDHPFVRLPGMPEEQRAAADDLYAFIRGWPGARKVLAESGLRDGNGDLDGLSAQVGDGQVELPEHVEPSATQLGGAAIAKLRDSWLASRKPVHLLVAIDESGSMGQPGTIPGADRMTEVRDALRSARAWLGPHDEFAITGFAAKARRQGGKLGPDATDLCLHVCTAPDRWQPYAQGTFTAATGGLAVRRENNDTPLYQAIMGAQQRVAARREALGPAHAGDIYAVIVMSDGEDDYWDQSHRQVLDNPRADVRGIPVYPVCSCAATAAHVPFLAEILRGTTGRRSLELDVTRSMPAAFAGAFAAAVRPSFRTGLGG